MFSNNNKTFEVYSFTRGLILDMFSLPTLWSCVELHLRHNSTLRSSFFIRGDLRSQRITSRDDIIGQQGDSTKGQRRCLEP